MTRAERTMVIAGIVGGATGLGCAIVGYMVAGIPGELVGLVVGLALAFVVGRQIGRRRAR